MNDPITVLAVVAAFGVAAQVVAARTKVPAIILLLASGVLLGPALDVVDPDSVYGPLLFPGASAAVAFLLFDGGLSLRFRELEDERVILIRLLTVGVLVTWVIGGGAAMIAGLPFGVAAIFGAIMTVTGPTVVIPLLREARLRPRITKILRWEGILVDPIGAVLTVVTFEAVVEGHGQAGDIVVAVATTVGAGLAVGVAVAGLIVAGSARHVIGERLEVPGSIAAVLVAVAVANSIYDEAGLVAATTMGVVLANQRRVEIRRIVGFHESMGIVLVGVVFILLAARVEARTLASAASAAAFVLFVLVFVARPAAVWASTIGSRLTANRRAYLAGMAPRGVVAASVSALFALRLEELGIPGGDDLAALAFLVVAGTVVIYGVAARPLARRLRVAASEPAGVVLVGGEPWLLDIGSALAAADVPVLVLSGDDDERRAAADAGLLTYSGPLQRDPVGESLDAVGARLALAGSRREELNGLAMELLTDRIGRAGIYVVAREGSEETNGRRAFGGRLTSEELARRIGDGYRFEVCRATECPDDSRATPVFMVSPAGIPEMVGEKYSPPTEGQLVVLRGWAVSPSTR